jgi:hypothetical protein
MAHFGSRARLSARAAARAATTTQATRTISNRAGSFWRRMTLYRVAGRA